MNNDFIKHEEYKFSYYGLRVNRHSTTLPVLRSRSAFDSLLVFFQRLQLPEKVTVGF